MEGAAHDENVLARLRDWQSFGERALLKNQPRFAGIRATSKQLTCLSVDQAAFEDALGVPLNELLPDEF